MHHRQNNVCVVYDELNKSHHVIPERLCWWRMPFSTKVETVRSKEAQVWITILKCSQKSVIRTEKQNIPAGWYQMSDIPISVQHSEPANSPTVGLADWFGHPRSSYYTISKRYMENIIITSPSTLINHINQWVGHRPDQRIGAWDGKFIIIHKFSHCSMLSAHVWS